MSSSSFVPTLMLATLLIVLVIAIVIFARFMRKRSNRHPMADQRERNIDEIRAGTPPERQ